VLELESLDESEEIKCKFLVEMPQDFYDFWEFAKTVNAKTPSGEFYVVCHISQCVISIVSPLFFTLLTLLIWHYV